MEFIELGTTPSLVLNINHISSVEISDEPTESGEYLIVISMISGKNHNLAINTLEKFNKAVKDLKEVLMDSNQERRV